MTSAAQPPSSAEGQGRSRSKTLQLLGILSGFSAGAWLGAAEAPTKLVSMGISPIAISLIMVIGVFLARWSLPALILGTSSVRADVRRAPHLIIWAVLAGCLWAVANTLTIFAIRDIGLSIAFPLWNSNSLLGIFWGFLFFNELRQAGWRRWTAVLGGALVMCVGAALLAIASSTQGPAGHSLGIPFLQRTAPSRLAPLDCCARRRARHVRWRRAARHRLFHARSCRSFSAGRLGRARRWRPLGHDVHSLSQGLSHRHEPTLFRHVFHFRRSRHDVCAGHRLHRFGSTLAGIAQRARRNFLADARRLRLGDWRSLPAIRRQVRGHQSRYSALQFQSALGTALGHFCFWRTARPQFLDVSASRWRIAAHDAGRWRGCVFFRRGRRTIPLERGGAARGPPLRCLRRLRRSTPGRPPSGRRVRTFSQHVGLAARRSRHGHLHGFCRDGARAATVFALGPRRALDRRTLGPAFCLHARPLAHHPLPLSRTFHRSVTTRPCSAILLAFCSAAPSGRHLFLSRRFRGIQLGIFHLRT